MYGAGSIRYSLRSNCFTRFANGQYDLEKIVTIIFVSQLFQSQCPTLPIVQLPGLRSHPTNDTNNLNGERGMGVGMNLLGLRFKILATSSSTFPFSLSLSFFAAA